MPPNVCFQNFLPFSFSKHKRVASVSHPPISRVRATRKVCLAVTSPFPVFRVEESSPNSHSISFPALVYIPGLEGASLPEFQATSLREKFRVLSLLPDLNAPAQDWDDLCSAALAVIPDSNFTLLGESFGAALALRIAAAAPNRVSRLILLNSGTALARAPLPRVAASLLPVLRVPGTYRLAARVLTLLLSDRSYLHDTVSYSDNGLSLFDVDTAPLPSVEHRVQLLLQFDDDFSDDCIKSLVVAPTVLIASAGDRLLPSVAELRRLQSLLPNVERTEVLPTAPHAALLDSRVKLVNIIMSEREGPTKATQQNGIQSGGASIAGRSTHTRNGGNEERRNGDSIDGVDTAAFAEAARVGTAIFNPWRQLVSPVVTGRENITDALCAGCDAESRRPILFVGNHAKYGMLDLPLLYMELAEALGSDFRLRSLAHESHFAQFDRASAGRWGPFVRALGAVPATARNFYALLAAGESVLLFPGGAREVCRRRGEEYELFWRSGTDFVRPAARFNALIVPFSAVGADDDCVTLIDGQEMQKMPVFGDFVRRALDDNGFDRELLMPLGGPPRMGRYYFKFHEIVDTKEIDPKDSAKCRHVYLDVKKIVQQGMQELLEHRENDPLRSLRARVIHSAFGAADDVNPGPVRASRWMRQLGVHLPSFDL